SRSGGSFACAPPVRCDDAGHDDRTGWSRSQAPRTVEPAPRLQCDDRSWARNRNGTRRGLAMPRGDKSKYTDKQKRKAEHMAEGSEDRGVPDKEAERLAWATVNKESGGGNKSGSGRGKADTHVSSKKGGKKGGAASASRTAAERSASAKKAAATRKRN